MSTMKLLIVLALVSLSLANRCSDTPTVHTCSTTMTAGNCWSTTGSGPSFTSAAYMACPALTTPTVETNTNVCVLQTTAGTCQERAPMGRGRTLNSYFCRVNDDCYSGSCVAKVCTALADGKLCMSSSSCEKTHYCKNDTGNSGDGRCTLRLVSTGGPCKVGMCAQGNFCNRGKDNCLPFLALGASCAEGDACGMDMYCSTTAAEPNDRKCRAFGNTGDACEDTGSPSDDRNFCNPAKMGGCNKGKCVKLRSQPAGTVVSNKDYCADFTYVNVAGSMRDYVCVAYTLDETSSECMAGQNQCKYTYKDSAGATQNTKQSCFCTNTDTPKSMCPQDSFSAAVMSAVKLRKRLEEEKFTQGWETWRPNTNAERLDYLMAINQEAETYSPTCRLDVVYPLSAGRITFGAILFVAAFFGMLFA